MSIFKNFKIITNNNTKKKFIITLSNQKGGSGKSTLCAHLLTLLLYKMPDKKISFIDLDVHQYTVYNFLDNRSKLDLPMPFSYHKLKNSEHYDITRRYKEEKQMLKDLIDQSMADIIIIDTGGNIANYTKLAIEFSHLMITPVNSSMIDINGLVKVENGRNVMGFFTSIVFDLISNKMFNMPITANHQDKFWKWLFIHNRVHHLYQNKDIVQKLNQVIQMIKGDMIGNLHDRLIFTKFLSGKTVIDQHYKSEIMNNSANNAIASIKNISKKIEDYYFAWFGEYNIRDEQQIL